MRPLTVTYGAACLGVSLLIGSAIIAFAWRELQVGVFSLVVVGSLTTGTLWWGWPRWVIAVMAVASLALTFPLVRFQFTFGILIPVSTGIQLALELLGFVLLFHPRSTRWYRRPRGG